MMREIYQILLLLPLWRASQNQLASVKPQQSHLCHLYIQLYTMSHRASDQRVLHSVASS